jgi:hypothetical protein
MPIFGKRTLTKHLLDIYSFDHCACIELENILTAFTIIRIYLHWYNLSNSGIQKHVP